PISCCPRHLTCSRTRPHRTPARASIEWWAFRKNRVTRRHLDRSRGCVVVGRAETPPFRVAAEVTRLKFLQEQKKKSEPPQVGCYGRTSWVLTCIAIHAIRTSQYVNLSD